MGNNIKKNNNNNINNNNNDTIIKNSNSITTNTNLNATNTSIEDCSIKFYKNGGKFELVYYYDLKYIWINFQRNLQVNFKNKQVSKFIAKISLLLNSIKQQKIIKVQKEKQKQKENSNKGNLNKENKLIKIKNNQYLIACECTWWALEHVLILNLDSEILTLSLLNSVNSNKTDGILIHLETLLDIKSKIEKFYNI